MLDPIDKPHVLLFDIDGTLIDSGGAGGGALLKALEKEFELDAVESVGLHGRTDLGIFRELLENHGIDPGEANFRRLQAHYLRLLPSELSSRTARVLPGVRDLLLHLDECEHVVSAILTGNLPGSARLKLEHHELWDAFEFGIYGDLAAHRPDLAAPAMELIEQHVGTGMVGADVTIIGDTPLDIALAKRMGARCLGVCTGGFEASDLREAGADHVVQNMVDFEAVAEWLLPTTLPPK